MPRTITKTAAAALIAFTMGSGAMIVPAEAGGQISIGLAPSNQQQANAMKFGLFAYALAEGLSGQGGIVQNGNGNGAGIAQGGNGNFGVVVQDGNGHNGTIRQAGSNNTCGLFQFGHNTNGRCLQSGGQTGTTFQFGW